MLAYSRRASVAPGARFAMAPKAALDDTHHMTSSAVFFATLTGVLGAGMNVAMEVALVVVVATTVQRARPDVVPVLLAAAALNLLTLLLFYPSQILMSRVFPIETMLQARALVSVVMDLMHVASRILLIWGIARLCKPALEPN